MIPQAPIHEDPSKQLITATLLLVAAVATGVVLGFVLRGFQGIVYIPFIFPLFVAWTLSLVLGRTRIRLGGSPKKDIVVTAALGAFIAYGAYHFLAYARMVDFLVENLATFADRAASNPKLEIQQMFEQRTGEKGLMAYLAFVCIDEFSTFHPLGLLARFQPGLPGTLLAIAFECALAMVISVRLCLFRSEGIEYRPAPPDRSAWTREILAHTDSATLEAIMTAIEGRDYEGAGQILKQSKRDPRFGLALLHDPFSAENYELEIFEVVTDGDFTVRARRQLSSWDGQAFFDEFRMRDTESCASEDEPS